MPCHKACRGPRSFRELVSTTVKQRRFGELVLTVAKGVEGLKRFVELVLTGTKGV